MTGFLGQCRGVRYVRLFMKSWLQTLSILVCSTIVGCAPFGFLNETHDALVWPVSLQQGLIESPSFKTKFGEKGYGIRLVAKSSVPKDAHDCYIGIVIIRETCGSYPNQINMRWEVWGDGQLVGSGTQAGWGSRGGWTANEVERGFGRFFAKQGVEYKLKINVVLSGELLTPAAPTFWISTCHNPTTKYKDCD